MKYANTLGAIVAVGSISLFGANAKAQAYITPPVPPIGNPTAPGAGAPYSGGVGADGYSGGLSPGFNYGPGTFGALGYGGGFDFDPSFAYGYGSPVYGMGGYTGGVFAAGPTVTPPAPINGEMLPVGPTAARNARAAAPAFNLAYSTSARRLSNGSLLLHWTGDARPVAQVRFILLDRSKKEINAWTLDHLPASALFTKASNARYYRVYIRYLNGTSTSRTMSL